LVLLFFFIFGLNAEKDDERGGGVIKIDWWLVEG